MPERPRIRFINHAGYVLESGDVRLAVDPWMEGRAFNDSWSLLSRTPFTYDDFRDVTHIWFSHEHPDHFSPPNLKKIPEEYRRRITVLYQESKDRRVVDWCRAHGFETVIELPADERVELAPDFEVLCGPTSSGDSWLLVKTQDLSVLNMNDCLLRRESQIEPVRELVGPIDVLFTQFSIASWDGNPEDLERRLRGARGMFDQATLQTKILEPRFVVPFASFVWFCHDDNYFMNEAVNRIDTTEQVLTDETDATPIILYPGDEWTPGEPHDNAAAIERYLEDYARVEQEPRAPCRETTEEQLRDAAAAFQEMLIKPNGRLRTRISLARQSAVRSRDASPERPLGGLSRLLALATLRVDDARIHIHDLGRSYAFNPIHGLRRIDAPAEECDVVTSAESACYAFRMLWGGETMLIAGTFREVTPGSRRVLFDSFELAKGFSLGDKLLWRNVPLRMLRRLTGTLPQQPRE